MTNQRISQRASPTINQWSLIMNVKHLLVQKMDVISKLNQLLPMRLILNADEILNLAGLWRPY